METSITAWVSLESHYKNKSSSKVFNLKLLTHDVTGSGLRSHCLCDTKYFKIFKPALAPALQSYSIIPFLCV